MKYKDNLKECIRFCQNEEHKEIYREYPKPTAEVWNQCIIEAEMCGSTMSDALSRYEVILARQGILTVSEEKAEAIIGLALYDEGISAEILKAMAKHIDTLTTTKGIKFHSGFPVRL